MTSFAAPCSKIAGGFANGLSTQVGEKVNPGWSRVYVRVLTEGELTVGEAVTFPR